MRTELFLLAMATAVLAGCTDDLERRGSYSSEGGLQATIPAYPFDGGTRVSISDDLQTFTWSDGDEIGMYYLDGDITAHAGFGILSGGGTTGTFTNSAFALHPSSTYYGFFPFDENATVSEAPVDFTGQVQTVNGSAAHLGAKNYMYSVVNTDGNGNAQINFHNLGSVMAIRVAAPATKTYSRLIIQSSNVGFTTKGNVNMANGRVSPTASSNLIILSFGPEGLAMNEGDMMSLYLLTAPENLSSSTLTFTLSAMEGGTNHLIGSMTGKNMLQGRAYLYDLTNRDAPYVTFTADATQTLRMNQEVPSLEYSVNGGTWTTLGTSTVTFGGTNGDLCLRGKALKGTDGAKIIFGNSTPVSSSGDICTLVDYENYYTVDTSEAVFAQLFMNCTQLVSAPELPSMQLAQQCYYQMFYGCTSLTEAPALPATTLAKACYMGMFQGCTSLTGVPELPATVMVERCYASMFANCAALTSAPELPATTLADYCYDGMFQSCSSLTSASELPAPVMAPGCYVQMFAQCSSLTEAPSLPAMELAQTCYAGMFRNCTSLTTAPDLPALELVQGCYTQMFYGCTSLNYIEMMAVDCGPQFISQWVNNVASSGIFVKNKAATWDESSIVPAGWTVETMDGTPYVTFTSNTVQTLRMSQEVSSLQYSVNGGTWSTLGTSIVTFGGMNGDIRLRGKSSVGTNGATITFGYTTPVACSGDIRTLVDYENYDTANTSQAVFKELFKDCTQLTTAPRLPATTLANECYDSMFRGCTSLTQAPKLPATTLAESAYHGMFLGCYSLTKAPELPALALAMRCYTDMFASCISLTEAPALPATTLAGSCYASMFSGCISLTRAPELPARTLATACYISMFANCQNLSYIKMMATDISATMCLTSWVNLVSPTGTFVKNALATWDVTGVDGIPAGWNVETTDNTPYVTFKSNAAQTLQMSAAVSSLQYSVNGGAWSTLGTNTVTFGGTNGNLRLRGKSSVGTNGTTISFGNSTLVACSGDIRTLVNYETYNSVNTSQAVFSSLFRNCTQLISAPELPATNLANSCYRNMFQGCSNLTTAPALPATTMTEYCYADMFSQCTNLLAAPELPATTLAYACYTGMFWACTNLVEAPATLPATTLADRCYATMFNSCTSLTQAPNLPAMELKASCYLDMFGGCSSLTQAPVLPANTLKQRCYEGMFKYCSNLNHITMLATEANAEGCLTNWVQGVSSTGTFVKNAAATWDVTGVSGIPEGWTVQTASE